MVSLTFTNLVNQKTNTIPLEIITFSKDIKVFYVKADSFPGEIVDAHKRILTLAPFSKDRRYFGISRPENGIIVYRAAAEEITDGEGVESGCDNLF